eukprot:scaffold299055_cov26-Tisochrysis_lutea.AAC.1
MCLLAYKHAWMLIFSPLKCCMFLCFTTHRSGQLSIECTINVGDASGVATTSIALVGLCNLPLFGLMTLDAKCKVCGCPFLSARRPPVCSRDSCLELEP